jgi:hypothetical protein
MTTKLDLTPEQTRWFAEQIIEWAAANIGSLLVIEVGVAHAISSVVTPDNIETAIEVIQMRLSDSALDPALITILGVLGIKALAEQISKDDKTFDLETSKRLCDSYAVQHSIDIDGAGVALLVRLIHLLDHPDLPDLLNHSDTLMASVTDEMTSGSGAFTAGEDMLSQYEELRNLERSTPTARRFIGLALSNITEQSVDSVAIEMKNILAGRHQVALNDLYDSDAKGG